MRMKSYDDYEEHVEDHAQMLDALRGIAAEHAPAKRRWWPDAPRRRWISLASTSPRATGALPTACATGFDGERGNA
jgi:hypothetical protein